MIVSTRAHRGAKHLDEVAPGWESRVNVFLLDMNQASTCVLGQVRPGGHGYYEYAALHGGRRWTKRHGFIARHEHQYPALQEAWLSEIATRIVNTIIEESNTKELVNAGN